MGVAGGQRYAHVVSLGYFCSTAKELDRLGLRDASYPLDWVISDIQAVMTLLRCGVDEFLRLEYLTRHPDRADVVQDLTMGVAFFHDFTGDRSIDEQYAEVRLKFIRRYDRLKETAADRTLFVRYVRDSEEAFFLDQHVDVLLDLLRQWNERNDLLLIGNSDVPEICGGIAVYRVEPDVGDTVARSFVRKSPALRRYLLRLDYPVRRRVHNLARHLWMQSKRRATGYAAHRMKRIHGRHSAQKRA